MKILFWKLKGLSDSAQSGLWVSGIAAAAAYLRLLAVFCEGKTDREKERERERETGRKKPKTDLKMEGKNFFCGLITSSTIYSN